ncbi:MAG: efflux RND transporter periplasmic adaptor subunit [Candidatus Gastranaerophilaceae bacterium]
MKHKILNILLILFVAVSFSGCIFHKRGNEISSGHKQITLNTEQEQNAKIRTEILKEQVLQLKITIPAQFKAMNKFLDRIYAPIDGKVVQVFVEPGNIVKIGQPLIEIKSDAIGQIQLDFLDKYIYANSNVKQMTAQYNLSVLTYQRENTLYHEGISSRAEYEVARAQMQKDRANLDSLKIQRSTLVQVYAQRVALYGGNGWTIARAVATKRIYPYITLRASKNGVVLNRLVNPGEIINQNRELFNVADLSTIWLVGYAFEKDAPLLKVGQNVTGVFEDTNTEISTHSDIIKGKLSYVASVLDTERKTLEVRADIPNEDFTIKPNMYAEMVVDVGKVNALAVPNGALQKYGDYNFAYVEVKPHVYEERKVEIGQHNDKYSEVKSGLKEGETVVSNGGFSLLGESIKMREE